MKTKKGDFVELIVTGKLEDGSIFDTNDKEVAKANNFKETLDNIIVCIGKREIVEGLDDSLEDKELNKEFETTIQPEKGFGKKDAKLFQLVSLKKFKDQEVQPYPGLQINIDGMIGTVKTVSGGRVMIDFNHPLSGRILKYNVKITRIVTETKEKVDSFLKNAIGSNIKHEITENKLHITIDLPEELKKVLQEEVIERIPEIKEVTFKK
ncbi:MAG: FKBP-type peptidyl-prolyl cis-trans isomerase [archaeon]